MDSRAALDLAPLGYEVRFTDEWFVRTGPVETAPAVEAEGVKIIRTAEELAEYEMGDVIGFGGISPGTPGHTYGAELLADERFTFYGMYQEGRLASGVFLFRDPRCLGVYAFFTLPEYRGRGLGTSLLQHVLSETPNVLLATNPSAMSRGIFTKLGFRAVGERRIWERATT